MSILGNYENNFDTETTTANNSLGFDPSAIQSCSTTFLGTALNLMIIDNF